ncbi:hypothetical protein FW774_13000 [Pedobacter sp. BS3]|uniref:hypothetical protein n=1 Tax=Pedobacter sp. BS3 TaxID=2567937 RepID=UPI0011EF0D7D|nr:hypothetical protein [Pedobacter sp. BS3]TZF83204.1 hypothetical protein FW774_13000 [Pedobacter sp. BS3]
MSEESKTYTPSESVKEANQPAHYVLMTISVIIGITGVLLRFASESHALAIVSNILFIIGVILGFKAVFAILK